MTIVDILIFSTIVSLSEIFIIKWEIKFNPDLFKDIYLTTRDLEKIFEYRERKKLNEKH